MLNDQQFERTQPPVLRRVGIKWAGRQRELLVRRTRRLDDGLRMFASTNLSGRAARWFTSGASGAFAWQRNKRATGCHSNFDCQDWVPLQFAATNMGL